MHANAYQKYPDDGFMRRDLHFKDYDMKYKTPRQHCFFFLTLIEQRRGYVIVASSFVAAAL